MWLVRPWNVRRLVCRPEFFYVYEATSVLRMRHRLLD